MHVSCVDKVIIGLCDDILRCVEGATKLSSYKVFILVYKMVEIKIVGRKEREGKIENRNRNNRTSNTCV